MATRRSTRRRRPSTSASRSGLRRPTATIPVRASATIPSGIEPTRSRRPSGVAVAGGERAGSAAGGKSLGAADPHPPTAKGNRARAARRRTMADTIAGRLATERKPARPRASTLVPVVLALGAAATVAYGISRDLDGVLLGAPHPPFIAAWDPRTHPAGWAAVALLVAAVVGAPRLLSARVSPGRFALAAFAGTLVLRLALAAGGTLPRVVVLDSPPLAAPAIVLPGLFGSGTEVFGDAYAVWTLLLAAVVLVLTGALATRTGGSRRVSLLTAAAAPLACGAM